mgnify:CR=1 FL=1
MYDISERSTFERVTEWISSIEEFVSKEKNIQKILVGNKVDLPRQVRTEEGEKLAASKNMPFFEVSAKADIGVDAFMKRIIYDVVTYTSTSKNGLGLNEAENSDNNKKACGC